MVPPFHPGCSSRTPFFLPTLLGLVFFSSPFPHLFPTFESFFSLGRCFLLPGLLFSPSRDFPPSRLGRGLPNVCAPRPSTLRFLADFHFPIQFLPPPFPCFKFFGVACGKLRIGQVSFPVSSRFPNCCFPLSPDVFFFSKDSFSPPLCNPTWPWRHLVGC